MPVALIVAAGIAAAGTVAGAAISSGAQRGAADSQMSAADKQLALSYWEVLQQQQTRDTGVSLAKQYASMSPEEISSVNRILQDKGQYLNSVASTLQKQQSLLDSVHPSVQAAGQDTLDLLNGKASALLQPIIDQRNIDRTRLQNQLSSQYGPGWQSSSAGIEAMTRFDQATSQTLSQAQLSALQTTSGTYSNLFGEEQTGQAQMTGALGDIFSRTSAANDTVLQANQFATSRLASAVTSMYTGNPVNYGAPVNAAATQTSLAGSQYAGQATIGNTLQNLGGSAFGTATFLGGANAIGSGGGNSSPFLSGGGFNPFSPSSSTMPTIASPTFGSTIAA